jgi:hypothetical protein
MLFFVAFLSRHFFNAILANFPALEQQLLLCSPVCLEAGHLKITQ